MAGVARAAFGVGASTPKRIGRCLVSAGVELDVFCVLFDQRPLEAAWAAANDWRRNRLECEDEDERVKGAGGYVITFKGRVIGWESGLECPELYQPGALALPVSAVDPIFCAAGNNPNEGAALWVEVLT